MLGRWGVCVAGLLMGSLLAACPAPPPPPAPPMPPTVIEASEDVAPDKNPVTEEPAKRCAAAQPATADCRSDNPGGCGPPCLEGDGFACRTLGDHVAPKDPTCAVALWKAACDRSEHAACASLAQRLIMTGHPAEAAKVAEKACEADHAVGCRVLGQLAASDQAALEHYDRGCELGDASSCATAASRYGKGTGVPRDRKVAAERLTRGCKLGDLDACVELAIAYLTEAGVARDPARALQLLDEVCRVDGKGDGGRSCIMLATYQTRFGGAAVASSEALHVRACDKGYLDACASVAQKLYAAAKYEEAIRLATKVIDAEPNRWAPFYARGLSYFDTGQFPQAAADLAMLCPLRPSWAYCPLWRYSADERAGGDGTPPLAKALKRHTKDKWPEPVFRFFLGRLSAPALERAAKKANDARRKTEQLCEAYYYIGQKHLIEGRKKAAERMFQKTIDTGISNFVEYAGAKAELARMRATP